MGRIDVTQGDITKLDVDAIVNAANASLCGGGGVDGAIHRAAGRDLLTECRGLGGCQTGCAKITKGYQLSAKYVIHTVGPVWYGGHQGEEQLLASCYRESLQLAQVHRLQSIAFPAISCGAYRFPIQKACEIAMREVAQFSAQKTCVDTIIFACFDAKIEQTLHKLLALKTR